MTWWARHLVGPAQLKAARGMGVHPRWAQWLAPACHGTIWGSRIRERLNLVGLIWRQQPLISDVLAPSRKYPRHSKQKVHFDGRLRCPDPTALTNPGRLRQQGTMLIRRRRWARAKFEERPGGISNAALPAAHPGLLSIRTRPWEDLSTLPSTR